MARKRTTTVEMLIQGRDNTRPAFNSAKNNLRGLTDEAQKFGAMIRSAINVAAGGLAVRLGVDGLRAGMAIARGDFEKVEEVVERLPFGLGEVAKSVKDLVGELSGMNAEIRKLETSTRIGNMFGGMNAKVIEQSTKALDDMRATVGQLMHTRQVESEEGFQRQITQIRHDGNMLGIALTERAERDIKTIRDQLTKTTREIQAEMRKLGDEPGSERLVDNFKKQLRAARVEAERAIGDINRALQIGVEHSNRLMAERLRRAAKANAQAIVDEMNAGFRDVVSVQDQIRVTRLELEGKTLEALRLQNKQHHKRLADNARRAGNDLMAEQLGRLSLLRDRQIVEALKITPPSIGGPARGEQSRFMQGVAGSRDPILDVNRSQLDVQKKQLTTQTELGRLMRQFLQQSNPHAMRVF